VTTCVTDTPDRLLHHCDVVGINGPSYRPKDRLAMFPEATMPRSDCPLGT